MTTTNAVGSRDWIAPLDHANDSGYYIRVNGLPFRILNSNVLVISRIQVLYRHPAGGNHLRIRGVLEVYVPPRARIQTQLRIH